MDFFLGKNPPATGMRPQNAERLAMPLDDDRNTADHAVFCEQGRGLKTRFLVLIAHHNRLAGHQGKAGLGMFARLHGGQTDASLLPTNTGPQPKGFAFGKQFKHLTVLDLKRLGDEHDHLVQERGQVRSGQGKLAQGGDHGLLVSPV